MVTGANERWWHDLDCEYGVSTSSRLAPERLLTLPAVAYLNARTPGSLRSCAWGHPSGHARRPGH
jgi:hypothetical protein